MEGQVIKLNVNALGTYGAWGTTILYLVIFFGIIYVMMIRPQQRQQKKHQEMLAKLKVNDHVVTSGGIHGRITKIKESSLILRIAEKVEVEFEKNAVAFVAGQENK